MQNTVLILLPFIALICYNPTAAIYIFQQMFSWVISISYLLAFLSLNLFSFSSPFNTISPFQPF